MTAKYPDRDSIAKLLADENIPNLITDHEPLLTIPPAIEHFTKNPPAVEAPYIYCKNLFLKNKQGGLYLITAAHDTKTDYKTLCKIFKAKKDSIREADKDKLPLYLHVEPGHVNSFSLLNLTDEQRKEVQFHLDKNLVDNYKTIGIPPMNSSSTCWIKPDDLIKLLEKNGFKVNVTDFTEVKLEEKKEEKDDKKRKKKKNQIKKKKKTKPRKKIKKVKKTKILMKIYLLWEFKIKKKKTFQIGIQNV